MKTFKAAIMRTKSTHPRGKEIISASLGFTIVELLIATAVFSVVLMTALTGFLQIGRLFYQGVSNTQTQAVTSQIFEDTVGNFQTAANVSPAQSASGYTYYCIGSARYTYNIGKKVSLSDSPNHSSPAGGGNFGMLKDVLPGATACATPCDDLGSSPCSAGANLLILRQDSPGR